jgi:hypothetical protein
MDLRRLRPENPMPCQRPGCGYIAPNLAKLTFHIHLHMVGDGVETVDME